MHTLYAEPDVSQEYIASIFMVREKTKPSLLPAFTALLPDLIFDHGNSGGMFFRNVRLSAYFILGGCILLHV
jgi:hypothetical protein